MFCPSCGTESSSDFDYCPKCGTNLRKIQNQMAADSIEKDDIEPAKKAHSINEQNHSGEVVSTVGETQPVILDPVKEAEEKIMVAFVGAMLLGIFNLGFKIFLYFKGMSGSDGLLLFFADPLLILTLGILLLKTKSRICAILLFLLYLLGKLALFLPLFSKELTPELQRAIAGKLPSQILYMAMFFYAFGNGIIGTFKFRQLARKSD